MGWMTGLLVIILFISACTHRSEEAFRQEMTAWKGRSEKELVQFFGYPQQKHTSPEGYKVYEYASSRSYIDDPWPFRHHGAMFGHRRQIYQFYCIVWFELKEQKVEKVTWRGNDCLSEEDKDP